MTNHTTAPAPHRLAYIVDVRLDNLTPHYVYTLTLADAQAIVRGSVAGVWEFVPTLDGGHELAPIRGLRYAEPHGEVRVHPLVTGATVHQRIVQSQRCMATECEYTKTFHTAR